MRVGWGRVVVSCFHLRLLWRNLPCCIVIGAYAYQTMSNCNEIVRVVVKTVRRAHVDPIEFLSFGVVL